VQQTRDQRNEQQILKLHCDSKKFAFFILVIIWSKMFDNIWEYCR